MACLKKTKYDNNDYFDILLTWMGLDENLNVSWWLKSKGQSETDVKTITNKGKETTDKNCYNTRCGIRPLINLKNKAF